MAGRRVGRLWLRDGFLFEAPTRPALALCQDAAPTPHSTVVPQSGSFIRLDLRATIPALLRRFLPPLIMVRLSNHSRPIGHLPTSLAGDLAVCLDYRTPARLK
jgi:hypothetical protein